MLLRSSCLQPPFDLLKRPVLVQFHKDVFWNQISILQSSTDRFLHCGICTKFHISITLTPLLFIFIVGHPDLHYTWFICFHLNICTWRNLSIQYKNGVVCMATNSMDKKAEPKSAIIMPELAWAWMSRTSLIVSFRYSFLQQVVCGICPSTYITSSYFYDGTKKLTFCHNYPQPEVIIHIIEKLHVFLSVVLFPVYSLIICFFLKLCF